ncbi:MAG: ribose-phosphate pyrophosphokinase [Clostridia bacterium]|nr:ribose-phosphate pyrophosphokinase [Clostridia bacterium]MBQ9514149.1 ribose-phosphate pyrophosphokinase [Clostridia bacterium]
MITHGNSIEILAGNSNKPLAEAIAGELGLPLSDAEVGKFSDGEISITLPRTVRGKDVFIIQSTSEPVNDNLMELLILIDACKRASAGRITAVLPYFGYARQDRKARPRDPITAKLVADILTTAGANRVLTMDLHAAQIQGFFEIPVDHLYGAPLLAKTYKSMMDEEWVVVSPDVGSVARARNFASRVNAPIAIVDKRRPKANVMEVMNIIGDVKGKHCLMVDDMIDTAGTICQGAQALMDNGALEVYACCTHGVLSGPAMERINASPIKQIAILDTINMPESVRNNPKIKVISVAKLFAKAITTVFADSSLSAIYED